MAHVVLGGQTSLLFGLFLGKGFVGPVEEPLLPVLYPLLHPLQLPLVLVALLEEVLCIVIELHVQVIELLDPADGVVVHLHPARPRAVVLHEGPDELQVKSSLKQVLSLSLELCQAEEGHVSEVFFGALQQDLRSLVLWDEGHVVAAHQAQVSQHPHLAVVGQVVRAIHELLQRAARPVRALVARGQLLRSWCPAITHVQGCFPSSSSLDVTPFAEVTRYGVSQQRDVVKFSTRRRENRINILLATGQMLGRQRARADSKKLRVNQHHIIHPTVLVRSFFLQYLLQSHLCNIRPVFPILALPSSSTFTRMSIPSNGL